MKLDLLGILIFGSVLLIGLVVIIVLIASMIVLTKALIRYIQSKEIREEKGTFKKSLGEVLKQQREDCKMTQQFVAGAIGVSRQAVSKWENGTSDPSTSNLISLAKLYKISVKEILHEVK